MQDLTIAFDLDGTLVETAPDLIHATNHVLGLIGEAPVPPAEIRPSISFGGRAMIVKALEIRQVQLSEAELRDAWQRLAREEGVFCEPASAAGVAALATLGLGGTAVAIVTGHGLKDTGTVDASSARVVDATLAAVLEEIR